MDWQWIGKLEMDWWIGDGAVDLSWIDIGLADWQWIGRLAMDWLIGNGLTDWRWIASLVQD